MKNLIIAAALAAFLVLPSIAGAHQYRCAPREVIVNDLKARNNQTSSSQMVTSVGEILEIFTAPDGGWTLVFSHKSGWSCVVAAGDKWFPVELTPAGQDT